MPLIEEMERNGKWLFRWRSYLPAISMLLLLVSTQELNNFSLDNSLNFKWDLICLAVAILGLLIRVKTIAHTPKGTSGRNVEKQNADSLNTTGIYSTLRNPLYLGNYFLFIAPLMLISPWWLIAIISLLFWLYYERIIFTEEAFLRSLYGDTYIEWASKTPAFIPSFKNWVKPRLSFSLKNVILREYPAAFGISISFFAFKTFMNIISLARTTSENIFSSAFLNKVITEKPIDILWFKITIVSAILYLIIRTIKKSTNLLKVEGR